MQKHKFRVGQRVHFVGRARVGTEHGVYEVVKLLPAESGHYLYRIKSELEAVERVVAEYQLAHRN